MTKRKRVDVRGETYGRLTITGDTPDRSNHRRVIVTCTCGAEKECFLTVLRQGDAISCGCHKAETRYIHGESKTALYRVWSNMKSRCNDPNAKYYPEYGGRGIKVCPEWNEYLPFKAWAIPAGYASGVSIDRTDNDLGYSPDNCRWVSHTMQQRNRRSQKGSSSQYVGVAYTKKERKWVASIKHDGLNKRLSGHATELAAAVAREQYITANNLQGFTRNNVL